MDVYRPFEERFDRRLKGIKSYFDKMDKLANKMRTEKQRLAGLEQDARHPRPAMEADVLSDTKTRERTEGAAAAIHAEHGNSWSAKRVQADSTSSASFGDDFNGPPTLPCSRDDALVCKGAATPKSCLSPLEMRTPTAAGGLLPVDTASTATRTTFDQPSLWFCPTEEINLVTSNQYATEYSSFWKMKVIQMKSVQNLVFDPDGSTGPLRACPFYGNVALFDLSEGSRLGAAGGDLERFLTRGGPLECHFPE